MNAGTPSPALLEAAASARFPDAPLFHAAWLFALGIVAVHWLWLPPAYLLIALGLVAALAILAAFRAMRLLWLPMGLLWMLLGAACAELEPQPAAAPQLAALSDGLLRTVEGVVTHAGPLRNEIEESLHDSDSPEMVAAPAPQPSQTIDLQVATLESVSDSSDEQIPVAGAVRLTLRWPLPASGAISQPLARCGERLRVVARLLPPQSYHDPGVWSREDFLLEEGITSTATVNIDRVEDLGPGGGAFLACRLHSLQHAASTRLLGLPARMRGFPHWMRLSGEDADLLAAMIAGDRTYLTRNLRVGFERTGSFHMLVVSGFHLAIVAGVFFWLAGRLRLPRVWATLATLAASFAYALFTGFATPVHRSLWMVTLYLLTRLLYRERNPMNTIGLAALVLLAIAPRSFFDSSFQMTLLAVVSIGGIAAPLLRNSLHGYLNAAKNLPVKTIDMALTPQAAQFRVALRMIAEDLAAMRKGRFSHWAAWKLFPATVRLVLRATEWVVISCVVELAMTLPMAIYFHRITLFALPVNVLILPLLLLLMPAALLTLAVLAVWPAAAVIPAAFVATVLHLGVGLVRQISSLALADYRIPAPLLWQAILFAMLLATALWLAHKDRRRLVWGALLLAALVAVLPQPLQHPHDALLLEAIDVGQGDSLLLITPEGKTLLVDGGGFGGGPRQAPQNFDIGEEVVSSVLWSRGIRHLDAVALTHAHSDHMGGLPAVLRNFHPDELWVGENPRVPAYTALLDQARTLGVRLRSLHAGDALRLGSAGIAVLAPFSSYRPGPEPVNNDSLVLHVAYGASSVLLEGDAEAPVEEDMLSESGLQSTLLKVGHHGSRTSTQPAFLARVHPGWAVISCGLRNRYGHPREEVLQELEAAQVRTFSTDIHGAVCFRLEEKGAAFAAGCARNP